MVGPNESSQLIITTTHSAYCTLLLRSAYCTLLLTKRHRVGRLDRPRLAEIRSLASKATPSHCKPHATSVAAGGGQATGNCETCDTITAFPFLGRSKSRCRPRAQSSTSYHHLPKHAQEGAVPLHNQWFGAFATQRRHLHGYPMCACSNQVRWLVGW